MKRRGDSADSASNDGSNDDGNGVFDNELADAVGDVLEEAGEGGSERDTGEDDGGDEGADGAGGSERDGAAKDDDAGKAGSGADEDEDGFEGLTEALGLGDRPKAAAPAKDAAADGAAPDGEKKDAPITREDGATWNAVAKRWTKDGAFVEGEPPAEALAGEAKTAADGAADATAGEKKAGWQPLSLKLDGKDTSIEEASIQRANGFHYLAIPDGKFERFAQRVSRGVAGERMWRQLDAGIRELEARKAAPPRKSDAEIESELTLELIKPYLPEFLSDEAVQMLEVRIENAKLKNAAEYETAEASRIAKAQEPTWDDQQADLVKQQVLRTVAENPELAALSPQELWDFYESELLPVRNAIVWKEGDQILGNTEYIYNRLVARAKTRAAAPSTTNAPPKSEGNANTGTTSAPQSGTPAAKAGHSPAPATRTKADNAETFNRGVKEGAEAAKPRTTSVKANRDQARPPQRTTRDDADRPSRRSAEPREHAHVAEDSARRKERAWLRNPTLDVPDDGDDVDEEL